MDALRKKQRTQKARDRRIASAFRMGRTSSLHTGNGSPEAAEAGRVQGHTASAVEIIRRLGVSIARMNASVEQRNAAALVLALLEEFEQITDHMRTLLEAIAVNDSREAQGRGEISLNAAEARWEVAASPRDAHTYSPPQSIFGADESSRAAETRVRAGAPGHRGKRRGRGRGKSRRGGGA